MQHTRNEPPLAPPNSSYKWAHSASGSRNPKAFQHRAKAIPAQIRHSPNLRAAINLATDLSLELAVEGYLKSSASILHGLWTAYPSARLDRYDVKIGLDLIWTATRFNPGRPMLFLPTQPELLEVLELRLREEMCGVSSDYKVEESRRRLYQDAPPSDFNRWVLIRALAGVRHATPRGEQMMLPPPAHELEALDMLETYLQRPPPDRELGMPDHTRLLALAVELCLKHKRIDSAKKYLDYLAGRVADGVFEAAMHIGRIPGVGKLLIDGVVAKRTRLSLPAADQMANDVVTALQKRIKEGEERPWSGYTWEQLLNSLDQVEQEVEGAETGGEVLPFINPPATDEAITEAESRLGVKLPKDLVDFYKVTNGLGSYDSNVIAPVIAPIEEIQWERAPKKKTQRSLLLYNHPQFTRDPAVGSQLVSVPVRLRYRELEPDETVPDFPVFLGRLPTLDRVLHVSKQIDDDEIRYWFIEPRLVKAARAIFHDSAQFLKGGTPADRHGKLNKRVITPASGKLKEEPLPDDDTPDDEQWMFVRYYESYEHVPFEEKSTASFRVYMERRLQEWMDRGY